MKQETAFSQWLAQQRHARDLTQRELADQVGCAEITIRKLESGQVRPSKAMATRLAECLGVPVAHRAEFVGFARFAAAGQAPPPTAERYSRPSPPNNLPARTTPLFGREAELAAICGRLRGGDRLLTLLGPPGIGKTRLAQEAARRLLDDYEHGAFFVPLAAVSRPDLVPDAIASAIGLASASSLPAAIRVVGYLRDRHILLVLDNCEHLIRAAVQLDGLLAACPWLTILATSREPLRIRAERRYLVPALAVPPEAPGDPSLPPNPDHLLQYSAIALFMDRAQAVRHDFELTQENAAAVMAICRKLDGLPLAIELVAARTRLFPPSALLNRWQGSWVLSTDGLQDVPEKQQTLRHALGWSYRLLSEREQRLLRRMAVFPGSADSETIAAICNFDGAIGPGTLEHLMALADKSLLQRGGPAGDEPRFAMLQVTREYALERLAAGDDKAGATQAAYLRHYAALAADGRAGLNGLQQFAWHRRLEAEHDNLRAALERALAAPGSEQDVIETGLRMAADLFWFWSRSGRLREGLAWFERGLEVTAAWGDAAGRAAALWGAGASAGYIGLRREARAHLDAAVKMCRVLIGKSDTHAARDAVSPLLAYALQMRGFFAPPAAYRQACDDLEESSAIFRDIGDGLGLAYTLDSLGLIAGSHGDAEIARAALEESAALFRRAGNLWGVFLSSANVARLATYQGDLERVREILTADANGVEKLLPHVSLVTLRAWQQLPQIRALTGWLHYLAHEQPARGIKVLRAIMMLHLELRLHDYAWTGLYEMAHLALEANVPARAARLLAGLQALQHTLGIPSIDPQLLTDYQRRIRAGLDEGAYATAWAEGEAMTLPQLAAYALSDED